MIKKIGLLLTILFINCFNSGSHATAESVSADRWKEDLGAAIDRAREEHRELHLVLGAWPTEDHIRTLIAKENPETAPIRVYWAREFKDIGEPRGGVWPVSSVEAPIIFENFNSEEAWANIKRILEEKGAGFNKIYFDWSTAHFAGWKFNPTTCIILSTLTHGGSLYIAGGGLKFSEINAFRQKQITGFRNKFRSGYDMNSIPLLGYGDQEYFLRNGKLSYWGVVIGSACPEVGEISLEEINNEAGTLYPLTNYMWDYGAKSPNGGQPQAFLRFTRP